MTFGIAIASSSVALAQDEGFEEEGAAEEEPMGEPEEEAAAEPAATEEGGDDGAMASGEYSISADGAFVLPLGDWADFSGPGIGVMARGNYQLQDKLQITGRLGYIYHLPKDQGGVDLSTAELLILGGARYDLGPAAVDVATGLNMWSVSVGDNSESKTRIALMLGASMPLDPVEIGVGLLIPNLLLTEDGEDTEMGIMATCGYKFM